MTVSAIGPIDWTLDLTEEGHRDYKLKWLCKSTTINDGPQQAFLASGLPTIGSSWAIGNDADAWAFCWPNWRIAPVVTVEGNLYWIIEQPFSTRPLSRCQTSSITDPLLEPAKLSGSFVTYTEEATTDRFGNALVSSSWEQLRGQTVEFDKARPTVECSINVLTLPLAGFAAVMHNVNDSTLWGVASRCVKLSRVTWERKLYGTCSYYYTINYGFDINFNTFDRLILDEGSRVLAQGGTAGNPKHYIAYKDALGENSRVILDGAGNAWDGTGSPGIRTLEKYDESNLLLLGIPASL